MESARTLPLPTVARRPGLEALRAWATVLVVVLHAAVPYAAAPMPALTWPVRHPEPSLVVDAVFWGIAVMIMPLFLWLSGYGAAQSLTGKPQEFLSSRWRRLGWPLIGAAAVLLPLELYVWLIGWALDGQIPWTKLRSLKLGTYHENLWGLSHLWYLEYLLIYSTLLWAGQRSMSPRVRSLCVRCVGQPMFLFLAAATVLWFAPEVVVGFQHGFLPIPAKFLFSGLFFAAGVAAARTPSRPPLPLGLTLFSSGALLLAILPLIHRQVATPLMGLDRLCLACGLAVLVVLITSTIWDAAWNSNAVISPRVRQLAQASFWIYLLHHPLVAIGHIALRPTAWSALTQTILVTAGTLVVSLFSYEMFVRESWLGAFLGGRSAVRTLPRPVPAATVPERRAA